MAAPRAISIAYSKFQQYYYSRGGFAQNIPDTHSVEQYLGCVLNPMSNSADALFKALTVEVEAIVQSTHGPQLAAAKKDAKQAQQGFVFDYRTNAPLECIIQLLTVRNGVRPTCFDDIDMNVLYKKKIEAKKVKHSFHWETGLRWMDWWRFVYGFRCVNDHLDPDLEHRTLLTGVLQRDVRQRFRRMCDKFIQPWAAALAAANGDEKATDQNVRVHKQWATDINGLLDLMECTLKDDADKTPFVDANPKVLSRPNPIPTGAKFLVETTAKDLFEKPPNISLSWALRHWVIVMYGNLARHVILQLTPNEVDGSLTAAGRPASEGTILFAPPIKPNAGDFKVLSSAETAADIAASKQAAITAAAVAVAAEAATAAAAEAAAAAPVVPQETREQEAIRKQHRAAAKKERLKLEKEERNKKS